MLGCRGAPGWPGGSEDAGSWPDRGGRPALRLAVNSTPGRGRLCTQRSGLAGARVLAKAGRGSLWGGNPGGKGAQCARVDHPGPRQLRGETASSEPVDTLHPGPLSSLVDLPTCLPADLGAAWAGPPIPEPTQDPVAESRPPSHSLERDTSPRSFPVPTSRPRPGPFPGHGPPRPQVTELGASLGPGRGARAQWGPARLLRCSLDAPRGLAQTSSPETPGSTAALPAAASRAGARLWDRSPQLHAQLPPRSRHPWCQQGAQGQGHPGCRAQAGLSQRVSGTEDGLSA